MDIRQVEAVDFTLGQTGRLADMKKLVVTFRNHAKAHKICCPECIPKHNDTLPVT